MSWTQSFTVLSEEHITFYESYSTQEERQKLASYFSHRLIKRKKFAKHIVCLSLSPQLNDLALRGITSSTCEPADLVALITASCRFLAIYHPETILRIYLDPVWHSIEGALEEGGSEVVLMDEPSNGPNPATLWPFLALEEGRPVSFLNIHELEFLEVIIERLSVLRASGLQVWRSPLDRRRNYRPIHPGRFGCLQSYPALQLLKTFVWYLLFGDSSPKIRIPLHAQPASKRQASWTRPDLAEFFLLAAIYPRAAFDGVLTLVEADDQHSRWLLQDIEYLTWANPAGEVHFVPHFAPSAARGESVPDAHLAAAMLEKLFLANQYPSFSASKEVREHASEDSLHCSSQCKCGSPAAGAAITKASETAG